jgi:hypothetical protein
MPTISQGAATELAVQLPFAEPLALGMILNQYRRAPF